MQTIKLLRLHNDELVISAIESVSDGYVLKEPFIVYLFTEDKTGRQSLTIDYWLPVPIIENNEAFIRNDNILIKMTPSSSFIEYYKNAVLNSQEKRKKQKENILEDEESLTQEEMKLLLENIDLNDCKYIN